MWNGYGMGEWAEGISMLAFLALMMASVVVLTHWFTKESRRDQPSPLALATGDTRCDVTLDIARERFDRGEITAEELEMIKRGMGP